MLRICYISSMLNSVILGCIDFERCNTAASGFEARLDPPRCLQRGQGQRRWIAGQTSVEQVAAACWKRLHTWRVGTQRSPETPFLEGSVSKVFTP